MSKNNHHLKSKAAAGAVLVALSGFVPTPVVQDALADTTTLNVTGKFISGITLSATLDVKLGSMIATGTAGSLGINGAAATAAANGTFLGTPAVGKIKITAAAVQPVDVKIAGFGALTLTGSATGTATLTKVALGSVLTAAATLTGGAATPTVTATGLNMNASVTTGQTLTVGATVAWTGNQPQGTFSQPLTVTVSY